MSTATKKIRINVTAIDIAKGVPGQNDRCPIARSMRRHGGLEEARIFHDSFSLGDSLRGERPLPLKAQWFVMDFDESEPVVPFSFTIEVPA